MADLFDFKGMFSNLSQSAKFGQATYRHARAWRVRRDAEKQGHDPLTIENAVEAAKKGRNAEVILANAEEARQRQEAQAELEKNPPPIHGSAGWSTAAELTQAGHLNSCTETPGGIFLGHELESDKPIVWDNESHLLTLAPTRTGKSALQIIPNLLRYRGSVVVLDPKGELAAATADWRAKNVGPVHVIDPFDIDPAPAYRSCFNPLDLIRSEDDAVDLAEILYPENPNDDKQRFFRNEALDFLAGACLFLKEYAPPHLRNVGTLRDNTVAHNKKLQDMLDRMLEPSMPPAIYNGAEGFLSKTKDIGIARVLDSIKGELRIWDSRGLRAASTHSDFSFEDVKERPTTIYIVMPLEKITPNSNYMTCLLAAALDAQLRNRTKPPIPTLFILDEFLALKPDDKFVSALRTHAGAGMRLWFFLQDLGTLEQKYPKTWQSFMQVEAKSFFGTDDLKTAEYISNYLGKKTLATRAPSSSGNSVSGGYVSVSRSDNLAFTARDLMTPQEVLTFMRSDERGAPRSAINFFRGGLTARARMTPWHLDPDIQGRCGTSWTT